MGHCWYSPVFILVCLVLVHATGILDRARFVGVFARLLAGSSGS